MPNLEAVISNPDELRRSVDRMCGSHYSRSEVRINHGFRTAQELQEWVCREPYDANDLDAIQAAADEMASGDGRP